MDVTFIILFFVIGLFLVSVGLLFFILKANRNISSDLNKANHEIKTTESEKLFRDVIIESMSDKQEYVCFVNPNNNTIRNYRVSGVFANYIDKEQEIITPAKFDYVLNKLIVPDDMPYFRSETQRATAFRRLANEGSMSVNFRISDEGQTYFYKCIVYAENPNSKCIVVSFSNVDSELRKEKRVNQQREHRDGILRICAETMYRDENTDLAIDTLLATLGDYYIADRAFVFEFSRNMAAYTSTYEWCRNGIREVTSKFQRRPFEEIRVLFDKMSQSGTVSIDDVKSDEAFDEGLKYVLAEYAIDSMIISPLYSDNKIIGFVGIDNPRENFTDVQILNYVTIFVYNEILRRKQSDQEHEVLENILESYAAVYYVNLDNDTVHNYYIAEPYKEEYGTVSTYRTSIVEYIERDIREQDRARVIDFTKVENLRKRFVNEDTITINYVDDSEKRPGDYEMKFIKVNSDGSRCVMCITDCTEALAKERKAQEELMDARDAAEAANRAKSAFLSRMSHDIRTPINGVIGMTEIARRNLGNDEKVADCLNKIDSASDHLLSLVNDVLDMSRIESGKTQITVAPVNLTDFCNECITILAGEIADKNIVMVKEFGDFEHPNILADELHLRQIIINIIGNSLKFTPAGNKVFFRVSEAAGDARAVTYKFVIEDTGIGMKPEFLDHIFEVFSQEHEENRSQYKGTGLGMSIARQLIIMMGGTIDVASTPGQGSTFTVTIPFEVNTKPVEEKENLEIRDVAGARVLLVEDNDLNLEIAKTLLESEDIVVDTAMDGLEALEKFEQSEPGYYEAILMDIMMPNMDGLTSTKRIRACDRSDAHKVPIIAMTANAFEDDIRQAREAGMNAHLSKPVQPKQLISTLAKFVGKKETAK